VPIPGCEGKYCHQLPEAVYPTAFYETVVSFLFFGLLWALRKRLRPFGALFALYLILNGVERFLIEKIRVNNKMEFLGLEPTQAEVISTGLVIVGVALWIILTKKYSAKPAKV
jgi:prolipoprotein diacylglyceryltransferase